MYALRNGSNASAEITQYLMPIDLFGFKYFGECSQIFYVYVYIDPEHTWPSKFLFQIHEQI